MQINLKQYFPMLRTRQEVLDEIIGNKKLTQLYHSWSREDREIFLDCCTGMRGIKILYDSFFKVIFNPDIHKKRLNKLLSVLLNQTVTIKEILPNESIQVAAENSLLIMDIVVELADGSIANVEVQKIGYRFPGERMSCYSSDLLLRQYKRVKDRAKEQGKRFSYQDIKNVYTIVLVEKSPQEFHSYPTAYRHFGECVFDTGIRLNLLQKYLYVPLDIYSEIMENKKVETEIEAWLMFLSTDEPARIEELISAYPEFRELYEEIYTLCCNTEGVMRMYSKELAELDHMTAEYMVDEMQKELDEQKREIEERNREIEKRDKEIKDSRKQIERKDRQLDEQKSQLTEKDNQINESCRQIEEQQLMIQQLQAQLKRLNQ